VRLNRRQLPLNAVLQPTAGQLLLLLVVLLLLLVLLLHHLAWRAEVQWLSRMLLQVLAGQQPAARHRCMCMCMCM
jgi:hypothetical protein